MTAQLNDVVRYASADWQLAGENGEGLFEPAQHGIAVRAAGSSCWRGFLCVYSIERGVLVLDTLHIATPGEPPSHVFGCKRARGSSTLGFPATYSGIGARVAFTGGLLIGRDFIPRLSVDIGFHPAWKYGRVVELILAAGRLTDVLDRSSQIAELRARLGSGPLSPGRAAPREPVETWIASCFSRKY